MHLVLKHVYGVCLCIPIHHPVRMWKGAYYFWNDILLSLKAQCSILSLNFAKLIRGAWSVFWHKELFTASSMFPNMQSGYVCYCLEVVGVSTLFYFIFKFFILFYFILWKRLLLFFFFFFTKSEWFEGSCDTEDYSIGWWKFSFGINYTLKKYI